MWLEEDKVHQEISKRFNGKGNEFPLNLYHRSVFVVSKSFWKHPTYGIASAANLHKVPVEHRFFNDLRWFIQDSCHFAGEANFSRVPIGRRDSRTQLERFGIMEFLFGNYLFLCPF